jgi:hypothetical protein
MLSSPATPASGTRSSTGRRPPTRPRRVPAEFRSFRRCQPRVSVRRRVHPGHRPCHETLLGAVIALRLHPADTATEKPILGRVGGEPDWIEADETPDCPSSAAPNDLPLPLYPVPKCWNFGEGIEEGSLVIHPQGHLPAIAFEPNWLDAAW